MEPCLKKTAEKEAKKSFKDAVFIHHIYEYKKGLRNLILHTTHSKHEAYYRHILEKKGIDFFTYHFDSGRMNLFFGAQSCVEVVRRICHVKLSELSPEEDFILGIMLGYDRSKQCERYIHLTDKQSLKLA